jgi:hypothetical protein
MPRSLLTLALLLATAACTDSPITSSSPTAVSAPAAATTQRATTVTTNEVVPLELTVLIPCVPETVSVSGRLHIVTHTTEKPDGSFHVVSHFNPQRVRGIGDSTGHTYRGTGATHTVLNVNAGVQETYANNFRFLGQGRASNYTLHENVHITVKPNGEVTSLVDNFKVTCD